MANQTPEKYKSIAAWGRMMGSYPYYVRDQIVLAQKDNAPAGATYKNDDGTWNTLADVTNIHTRIYFEQQHPELFNEFMKQDIVYSTLNPQNTIECYCDGYDRQKVIDETTAYFENKYAEEGEYGEFQEEVILFTLDESGDDTIENEETITLDIIVEEDTYDGGRFDYYNSRL